MSSPRRLLAGEGTPFEQELLRSAAEERPSALLQARMEQGVGVALEGMGAVTTKLLVSLVGSGLLGGAVWYGATLDAPVVEKPAAPIVSAAVEGAQSAANERAANAQAATLRAVEREQASLAQEEESVQEGEPVEDASGIPPVEQRAAKTSAMRPSSTLAEEVQLLDAVRSHAARGDRHTARRLLDRYASRFPDGVLRPEAAKLRKGLRVPR